MSSRSGVGMVGGGGGIGAGGCLLYPWLILSFDRGQARIRWGGGMAKIVCVCVCVCVKPFW